MNTGNLHQGFTASHHHERAWRSLPSACLFVCVWGHEIRAREAAERGPLCHGPPGLVVEEGRGGEIIEMLTLLDLCVSSLRRGRANLLCIVQTLTDDPRIESEMQQHCLSTVVVGELRQEGHR